MRLVIVESPGKVKKIQSFLGKGWRVKASVGHVRDLPQKGLGIHFDKGKVALDYEVSKDKTRVVRELRQSANEASEIFLAMDMDREGEAIAWHVGMLLGEPNWSKIKRVTFTEITQKALEAALRAPRRVSAPLVHAQQARRAVDRLVGFQVSPLLWKRQGLGKSAGRVQSVAVRLVVERERAIRDFKPQEYWKLKAHLQAPEQGESFWAELIQWDSKELVNRIEDGKESKQRILSSKEDLDAIVAQVKQQPWTVLDQQSKEQQQKPYPPFITSTLQQAGNGRLKWTSKQTMQVAQGLYEKGLITYMRTDSTSIADDAIKEVRGWIGAHFEPSYLPKSAQVYQKKVKNAQEAHECIRPTSVATLPEALEGVSLNERQLYDLIWRRYVACQMAAARYHVVTVDVGCGPGLFRAKGRRLLFDGWQRVAGKVVEQKEEDLPPDLPQLQAGQALGCLELKPSQHYTQAPARYSEASLIKALEKMGIGRPSTYAAIIETIRKRGYVREEKRVLHAEPVGEAQVDYLMQRFQVSFMDYTFTAEMEAALDAVAEGERSWHDVVIGFHTQLVKLVGV